MVKINKTSIYTNFQTNSSSDIPKTTYQNSIWGTNINGEIENTKQGNTGDCWLLTNLNCLRDTNWGKKIIKNSIKSDWAGGVIITFKGAKTDKKEFHITVDEIINAHQSGIYSSGDDDVIAMELAVEKYLKLYRNQEDKKSGEAINGNGLNTAEFAELLSGEKANLYYSLPAQNSFLTEVKRSYDEKKRILEEIEKNPGKYAVSIGFTGTTFDGVMIGNHAYQLQKVITEKNKKYVILVNPHNSSEKIKMDLDKFIQYSGLISITEPPNEKTNYNLMSDLDRDRAFIERLKYLNESIGKMENAKDLDLEQIKDLTKLMNKNNVKYLTKSNLILLIYACDKLKSGWGNGEEKKVLIAPIVDAYCEYAKEQGVAESIIQEVKTACVKELDAMFYTDESVIVKNMQMLFEEVEKAKDNDPFKKIFGSKGTFNFN